MCCDTVTQAYVLWRWGEVWRSGRWTTQAAAFCSERNQSPTVEGWRWRGRRMTTAKTYRQQDIVITTTRLCDTLGDTVLEQTDSSPVGLPVGHLTSSSVDHGVVAAKQRWFPSSPAHLVSALDYCLHTTWQRHPLPGHSHHRLRDARRHTSYNRQTHLINGKMLFRHSFFCLILHWSWIWSQLALAEEGEKLGLKAI